MLICQRRLCIPNLEKLFVARRITLTNILQWQMYKWVHFAHLLKHFNIFKTTYINAYYFNLCTVLLYICKLDIIAYLHMTMVFSQLLIHLALIVICALVIMCFISTYFTVHIYVQNIGLLKSIRFGSIHLTPFILL